MGSPLLLLFLTYGHWKASMRRRFEANPEYSHQSGYLLSEAAGLDIFRSKRSALLRFITFTPGYTHLTALIRPLLSMTWRQLPFVITFGSPAKSHLYSRPPSPQSVSQSCNVSPSTPVNAHHERHESLMAQGIRPAVNNLCNSVLQVNTNSGCVLSDESKLKTNPPPHPA